MKMGMNEVYIDVDAILCDAMNRPLEYRNSEISLYLERTLKGENLKNRAIHLVLENIIIHKDKGICTAIDSNGSLYQVYRSWFLIPERMMVRR